MEPQLRTHSRALRLALGLALVAALGAAVWSQPSNSPAMAPGPASPPSVEALLPRLLRAYHGAPYDVAAIRFAPELWAALGTGSRNQQAPSVLPGLFDGGLLFGIGPLQNWLALARPAKSSAPAVGWSAPPGMQTELHLEIGQTEVIITGQRPEWVRRSLPKTDAANLFNQLELVWFPLAGAGGERLPVNLAQFMRLVVNGLAPGVTQTFDWVLDPLHPQNQTVPPQFVQRSNNRQGGFVDTAGAPGMGGGANLGGGMGGAPAAGPGRPAGYSGVPGAVVTAPTPAAPVAAVPAGPGGPGGMTGLAGPAGPPGPLALQLTGPAWARAGTFSMLQFAPAAAENVAPPPAEAAVGVNQVTVNDGLASLDYWTSPVGRQEVAVLGRDSNVLDRVSAGPAPQTGQGMASWRAPRAPTKGGDALAFSVRNVIDTPQGAQTSEAIVPLPTTRPGAGPTLRPRAPAAGLTVTDVAVDGNLLNMRVNVPPTGATGNFAAPLLVVTVTDETGRPVRQFRPQPPLPGGDYVFGWDATDQADQRVPDGRYVLRVSLESRSEGGVARSECRYWVDVPLAETARRLALLNPTTALPLPVQLEASEPGRAVFALALPLAGRLRAAAIDADGRTVRRLCDDSVPAGLRRIVWDGADAEGHAVPGGSYTVQFELDGGDRGAWASVTVEIPQR